MTTVSTGDALDTDGYVAEVEGAGSVAIGINGTATLSEVPAGDVEIRLARVRGNCTVQGPHPRVLRVVAGETFQVHFDVACAATPMLGRIVFYAQRNSKYDLFAMNPDGSDIVQLTDTPEEEREVFPAVSPDGRKILFTNRVGPEDDAYIEYLYVMNADGTERVKLPPLGGGILGEAVWSPDGSRIAFAGDLLDGEEDEIRVMSADGAGLVNVTNTPDIAEFTPAWSPDGRQILFASSEGLGVMNSDGTGRRLLLDDTHADSPRWSPDGTRIVFLSQGETRDRVYVMNADGSDPEPLLPDGGGSDGPASWSPTGDRLVLARVLNSEIDIYVVNSDGSGMVNVSDSQGFEYLGAQPWGP
ncbi:MAG TPA: hypothetical protein VEB59_13925 [Gemmatimonadales bacterium]|nr:hypothetical protein [Gemmatimonadales bacterium]